MARTATKVNKMAVVREALATLGNEASTDDLQAHLKRKGVEMDTRMLYTYKSNILRAQKENAPPVKRGRPAGSKNGTGKAHTARPAQSSGSVSFGDIATVKALSAQIGPEKVSAAAAALEGMETETVSQLLAMVQIHGVQGVQQLVSTLNS